MSRSTANCAPRRVSRPSLLRPSQRHPRLGATLIDLVITVLIISILAAAATPRFAAVVARLRAEAVARRIAADLNFARRTAMQTSRLVTITFRASPAGYSMTNVPHPAHPAQSYTVDIAEIDSGVALTAYSFNSGATLSFNGYGIPHVGGASLASGTITVTAGGHSFTVAVAPTTGEAAVP